VVFAVFPARGEAKDGSGVRKEVANVVGRGGKGGGGLSERQVAR